MTSECFHWVRAHALTHDGFHMETKIEEIILFGKGTFVLTGLQHTHTHTFMSDVMNITIVVRTPIDRIHPPPPC